MSKKHCRFSRRKRAKIRNSRSLENEHGIHVTNIEEKLSRKSDHSATAPTRPRELGGKHCAAPTGFRHVSKLCDKLLQQFADEYASPEEALGAIDAYMYQCRMCRLCGAVKHVSKGVVNEYVGTADRFYCNKCVDDAMPDKGETVKLSSPQKRIF